MIRVSIFAQCIEYLMLIVSKQAVLTVFGYMLNKNLIFLLITPIISLVKSRYHLYVASRASLANLTVN